jgi:paraquat-inducible protein B
MTDESTNEQSRSERDELPRPVVQRRRVNASLIWVIPALAAIVGIALVINNWLETGPDITISFQSAEGIDAGKTPVKYKNVVIGRVKKIHLSRDRSHVLLNVALEKCAEGFAT